MSDDYEKRISLLEKQVGILATWIFVAHLGLEGKRGDEWNYDIFERVWSESIRSSRTEAQQEHGS